MQEQPTTLEQKQLLSQPIAELPMSAEFIDAMAQLGFENLDELSKRRTIELGKLKGFNVLLIHEYVNFMEKKGLGELIDP